MRTPVIAGNWKMNKTIDEALELVKGIHYGLPHPGEVEVVVGPTFAALNQVAEFLKNSYIGVTAQNMHWEENGAFTGELSGLFLKDAGADYVIIGHSERREYFGETDETVNKKTHAAFNYDLIPIVCVGETLEQREADQVEDVIRTQITNGLDGLTEDQIVKTIVAYEPVWAIGTGKTATPEQAEEVHAFIRSLVSDKTRILYGGSMKPANSKDLLSQENIDGGLIGGAALKPDDFIQIIKSA